jgi:hypothetical protein
MVVKKKTKRKAGHLGEFLPRLCQSALLACSSKPLRGRVTIGLTPEAFQQT